MISVGWFHVSNVTVAAGWPLSVLRSNTLLRWLIFRQVTISLLYITIVIICVVKMHHLSATPCQNYLSFGRWPWINNCMSPLSSFVLSRCPIFWQYPITMTHLSTGHNSLYVTIIIIWVVKMPHLIAMPCLNDSFEQVMHMISFQLFILIYKFLCYYMRDILLCKHRFILCAFVIILYTQPFWSINITHILMKMGELNNRDQSS